MKNLLPQLRNVFQNRYEELTQWKNHLSTIRKEQDKAKGQAYDMGFNGPEVLSLLNSRMDATYDRIKTTAEADLEITSQALKTELQSIEKEIADNPLDAQVAKGYHGGHFPAQDMALSFLEGSIARKERRLETSKAAELEVLDKLERLGTNAAPSVSIWNRQAGQIILALLVSIGEFILLVPLLEATGTWGSTIELYMFCGVLTSLLAASTHISAQFLADHKPVLGALSIFAGLLLIGALLVIRWNDANSIVYMMVNTAFFLLGILVAYQGHKTSSYVDLVSQRRRLSRTIRSTSKSLARLKGLKDGIIKISQRRAIRRGFLLNESLNKKRANIIERRSWVEAKFDTLAPYFDSLRKESFYEFQISFASGRRWRWIFLVLGILAGMYLAGCTSPVKDEYHDLFLVFDASMSNSGTTPSAEAVVQKVDEILKLNERRNGRFGVNVYIGSLGESKIPNIRKVTLDPGAPYLTRTEKKRIAEINDFEQSLKSTIHRTLTKPPKDRMTRANAGLCYFLNYMMEQSSKEDVQRDVLIFSDLVEASSVYTFPSSTYKTSSTEKNYGKITRLMKADCVIPPLKDISFEICHQPPVKLEDQFLAATAFWKKYLQENGAKEVKISGGLE